MAASGHSMALPKCLLSRSRGIASLSARKTRYNVHLHGHCTMAANGHSMALPKCLLSRSREIASLSARKTRYNVHLHGHCTIKSLKIHLLRNVLCAVFPVIVAVHRYPANNIIPPALCVYSHLAQAGQPF